MVDFVEERLARPTTQVGALIHDCARIRRTVIDKALRPIALTRAQRWVLIALEGLPSPGLSQKDLAAKLGVGQVAVGERVMYLEAAGLLQRGTDPQDRRQRVISITAGGREALSKSWELSDRVNEVTFEDISDEEIELLSKVLSRIRDNLRRAHEGLE